MQFSLRQPFHLNNCKMSSANIPPLNLLDVTCILCKNSHSYQESDIHRIIRIFDRTYYFDTYQVLCKSGCKSYIDISCAIPELVKPRINSFLNRTKLSCPECFRINEATNGKLHQSKMLFGLIKFTPLIKYECECKKPFYIRTENYKDLDSYLKSRMIDDKIAQTED